MRAVVSGAAGFIGFHLCRRLLDDGHEIVGLDNLISGTRRNIADLSADPRFTFVEHDIVEAVGVDGQVDAVFNLACPASPLDFERYAIEILSVCSQGTRCMLDLARDKGAVMLHASTSECYGDPEIHPQPESYWGHVNPIGTRACYDEGKRFAEALVMTYHRRHALDVRIFRIFNTYGPRMRSNDGRVLPNLINQALRGEQVTIYGEGSQTRSFCYVSDLVDAVVKLPDISYAEPINLGSTHEITILNLAELIITLCESRSTFVHRPLPQDDPTRRKPEITLAQKLLGWSPTTPLNEGLQATIEFFRRKMTRTD